MGKIVSKLLYCIYFVFILVILYSIITFSTKKYIAMYLIIAMAMLIMYLLVKKKKIDLENKILKRSIIVVCIICTVIGVALRIGSIILSYIEPFSDYLTFYYNAASYANTSSFANNNYIALFPYLSPYIFVLGNVFKVLGVSYRSAVIFNVFLDTLAGILLYLTFRNSENKLKPLCILAIWMINPFNILWCSFVAPITIVNFFFVLGIFIFEKREKMKSSKKKFLAISILLGIVLGIANQFRPIFIIFVIALILYELYNILFEKEDSKLILSIGILLVICMYFISGKAVFYSMEKINKVKFATSSGWTIYLGANLESKGTWNSEDSLFFNKKIEEGDLDAESVQKYFMDLAIERYKTNGIKNNIRLMRDKFEVLTGDVPKYSTESWWYVQENLTKEKLNIALMFITKVVYTILILTNVYVIFAGENIKRNKFYLLLVMGLIASHLLVEVSPRYNLHVLVPMQIILTLLLFEAKKINKE